jgi:radical SAM superfamily enzyme YgiQ (UPF0313 family)
MEGNNGVCVTLPRKSISDLDCLPFVNRSFVDYEKYNRYIGQAMIKDCMSLQATRGCPFKCSYCHKVWPKAHLVRSAENIFEEVKAYYDMGVKRFAFVDDIFNFDIKNSIRFYQLVIKNNLDLQLFFPNGLRGDMLTTDYIDLMVEAGAVDIAFALETGSPRIQKLVKKHLNIDRFQKNIQYTCTQYPHILLELQTMHGFPTETEEEAMMTLDFIFDMKWLDFPYINVLKIFPNTEMEELALENGVTKADILKSRDLTYDELPATLPFDKNFSLKYQAKFLHEYFLSKERLISVLPSQMKLFTENELVQKYSSYMPGQIKCLDDLLTIADIKRTELTVDDCVAEETYLAPQLNEKIASYFPAIKPNEDAVRVLLLDLSLFFADGRNVLYDVVEPPLGLMFLMSYLEDKMGARVNGKIAKSRIDFDNHDQLKSMIDEFKPHVIGIRSLTLFKEFVHQTIRKIRDWGVSAPIVTGGPYATSDYTTILQDKNVDLVVLGEGEATFHDLLEHIVANGSKPLDEDSLKRIPGIVFVPGRNLSSPKVKNADTGTAVSGNPQHRMDLFNDDLEDE